MLQVQVLFCYLKFAQVTGRLVKGPLFEQTDFGTFKATAYTTYFVVAVYVCVVVGR